MGLGVHVQYGVVRDTTEEEFKMDPSTHHIASQAKDFFNYLIRPSGGEESNYKRMRLNGIPLENCKITIPLEGSNVADGVEVAENASGEQEPDAEKKVEPLPGYWVQINKKDKAYVFTVKAVDFSPAGEEDDDDGASTVMLGATAGMKSNTNFEQDLQDRLNALNLTTIASGVTHLGHKRARLKARRDQWALNGTEQEKAACPRVTARLMRCQAAEDMSKPELLHSLDDEPFEKRMGEVLSHGTVCPVNLAVEVNNRKCAKIGKNIVETGHADDIELFFDVVMPPGDKAGAGDDGAGSDDDVAQLAKARGEEDDYYWLETVASKIPGTTEQLATRYESALFSYLFTPLINTWGHGYSDTYCVDILEKVQKTVLEKTPANINPTLRSSVNLAVTCCRTVFYTNDPMGYRFEEEFEKCSNAEPICTKGWKGLLFNFWHLLLDARAFRSPMLSLKSTKVCFKR